MHVAPAQIVYTRPIHGSVPVRVVTPGRPPRTAGTFELLTSTGAVSARYDSARSLIAAITGHKEHSLSFDRYFNLREDRSFSVPEGGDVLNMFPRTPRKIAVARTRPREETGLNAEGLGINLRERGHEVRKLLFAGFGVRIARSGYDPEEVLQEVYRGILARNRGKCPFDARRSSFGHYVHMVAECVLLNYHRREQRRREIEQVGMQTPLSMRDEKGASTGHVDALSVAERSLESQPMAGGDMKDALRGLQIHLSKKAQASGTLLDPNTVRVASLLIEGFGRREIAQTLGVSPGVVAQIVLSLRENMIDWL